MRMTKARFQAEARASDVEVVEEQWSRSRHFHAYAPEGQHFLATETRNIGLGCYERGDRPDWEALRLEIRLEPCTEGCDHEVP